MIGKKGKGSSDKVNVLIDWGEYYPWYYLPKHTFSGSVVTKMTPKELKWVKSVLKEHGKVQKFLREKGGWKD